MANVKVQYIGEVRCQFGRTFICRATIKVNESAAAVAGATWRCVHCAGRRCGWTRRLRRKRPAAADVTEVISTKSGRGK